MSRSQATEDTEPAAYFMRSPLRTLNALAFKLFINIKTLFLLISVVQKNKKNQTYGSFCRIECAPIPYKHRHSERFKVLSCKIELFNSSIGHFAG